MQRLKTLQDNLYKALQKVDLISTFHKVATHFGSLRSVTANESVPSASCHHQKRYNPQETLPRNMGTFVANKLGEKLLEKLRSVTVSLYTIWADLHGAISVACNMLKTGLQLVYDCRVRQRKCRSILKHVLKRCDNRKSCHRPVVSFSPAPKSHSVNRPEDALSTPLRLQHYDRHINDDDDDDDDDVLLMIIIIGGKDDYD